MLRWRQALQGPNLIQIGSLRSDGDEVRNAGNMLRHDQIDACNSAQAVSEQHNFSFGICHDLPNVLTYRAAPHLIEEDIAGIGSRSRRPIGSAICRQWRRNLRHNGSKEARKKTAEAGNTGFPVGHQDIDNLFAFTPPKLCCSILHCKSCDVSEETAGDGLAQLPRFFRRGEKDPSDGFIACNVLKRGGPVSLDLPCVQEQIERARPANTMVDGSGQPRIGYFAILAA